MPGRRQKRPSRIRRKNRGIAGGRRTTSVALPVRSDIIPDTLQTHVRYSVTYAASAGTALSLSSNVFQFTGNSIFNPDLNSIVENYPKGVVEWAGLYVRYQVVKSEIECIVNPASSTSTIALSQCKFILYPHAYSTALPGGAISADDLVGQPRASRLEILGPLSGTSNKSPLRMSMTSSAMFARPDSQLRNSEEHSGFLVSNTFQPHSQWFWSFIITNNSGAAVPVDARITFNIRYTVRLYQPRGQNLVAHDTTGTYVENVSEPEPPCLALALPALTRSTAVVDPSLVLAPCHCQTDDDEVKE